MHPDFAALLAYAVGAGLAAEVYSNLTHVKDSWWELFACPQVSLATSYYSDDPREHDAITGRPGSHARTLANIGRAVSRGIPVRAGIIELADGQRTGHAQAELEAIGVRRIRTDRVRRLGRAASTGPDPLELCGNCGRGIAAVLPSGDVCPCVMARWLTAGNVRDMPLAEIVPRHVLVPSWFSQSRDGGAWVVRDGPADEPAWLDAAYDGTTSLVTRVGAVHADHAEPGARHAGRPASSATMPRLVLDMYRRARLYDGASILDVGTGSGYGAALLAARYGPRQVTSIDVDGYLTSAAASRLAGLGLHPAILTCDAAGDLPGTFDRIVPMVSLPAIPASWLAALRPDGRLVFSLAGGPVLITARKTPDGGAAGRVEYERAGFMPARHGPAGPQPNLTPAVAGDTDGGDITTSPYPVVDPA